MKVKVVWDFGDTDLENVPYDEAIKESELPLEVAVPEEVAKEGEEGVTDWLSDEYGYTHFGWEKCN